MTHIIVDYSFLYYKYKFQLDSGRMKRLTAAIEDSSGIVVEKDVSQIYYSLREIESFRKEVEKSGEYCVVSVCFDMPSARKQAGSEETSKYKSNRGNKLNDDDFANIRIVQNILRTAGYNVYVKEYFEADDLVAHLVNNYASEFDRTIIYTPDADLMVNIRDKVAVKRYKSKQGYTLVDMNNFSDYLSAELKCFMPYNALMLFKCTVGDKSDCIDGIKGFGPKAFENLCLKLNTLGLNWSVCGNADVVDHVITTCGNKQILTEDQVRQAKVSLSLVRPQIIEPGELPMPTSISTYESRAAAYSKWGMKSLI